MDTSTLVRDTIDDGKHILDQLQQADFEVTAGFWLKESEDSQWRKPRNRPKHQAWKPGYVRQTPGAVISGRRTGCTADQRTTAICCCLLPAR